jgi:hypothetical protein
MKPEGSLLQLVALQGQLNPALLIHYFFNMLFNIILTSSARSPKLSRADFRLIFIRMYQGYTNSGGQVAVATKSNRGVQYLWAHSVEFGSCRPVCSACNFEVASRFLENLCIPDVYVVSFTRATWNSHLTLLYLPAIQQ